ncbi:MAG: chaperone modulator CbpM [Legionella sp.]|jgi:chaperone modulatory protein CbpM
MSNDSIITGVIIEETVTYSVVEVCDRYHIPEQLVEEMIEHGLFDVPSNNVKTLVLHQKDLQKIESAMRLHQDLGINLPGVALALDLLEQLENLSKELDVLRRYSK